MRTPLKCRWHYKKYTNPIVCFFLLSFMHFNNQKEGYELLETEDIIKAFQKCILSSWNLLGKNYEILFLNLTLLQIPSIPSSTTYILFITCTLFMIKIINIEGEIKRNIIFHQSKFFFWNVGIKVIYIMIIIKITNNNIINFKFWYDYDCLISVKIKETEINRNF